MNKERREIVLKKITNWTKDWDRKNPFFSHNLTHDLKLHSFNDEQTEIRDVLRYVADDPNYVFKDNQSIDQASNDLLINGITSADELIRVGNLKEDANI